MNKSLLIALVYALAPAAAFAMPCDSDFTCVSASGKYQISAQRCRYDNQLGVGVHLTVDGKAIEGAAVGANWDGDQFAGLEISFPDQGDTQRIVSIEASLKSGQGTLRDKTRNDNPAPWKTTHTEAVKCSIDE